MYEPRNIDLNIVIDTIYSFNFTKNHIVNVLNFINNCNNPNLIDDGENTYTFSNKNIKSHHYKNNIKSSYLNYGSNSVVFVINYYNSEKILKISNTSFDIEKYKKDKNLYPINIPSVYMYGFIYNDMCEDYYDYIITDYVETLFNNLTFDDRYKYIVNLLNLIITIHKDNHIINDLKLSNLGFDNQLNVIIIDYEQYTIHSYYDEIRDINFTYLPYYFFKHYELKKIEDVNIYDKIEIMGFFEIMLKLLFKPYYIKINNKMYSMSVDFFYLKHHYKLYKNENDCLNNINHMIDTSSINYDIKPIYYNICHANLKIIEFNNIFIKNLEPLYNNPCYKYINNIIHNILDHDYNKIPSFEDILNNMII
jgi:hypothetical protein